MPVSSYPDKYVASTLAYNTATASSLNTVITSPSSSQTVNPLATPTVKVFKPTTNITLNFDIQSNYVGASTYTPLRGNSYSTTSATTGYIWLVEFVPNTSGQQLNFAVSLPASGTSIVWDGGSTPSGPTTYAVYQFYTLDGSNIKARVLVNY